MTHRDHFIRHLSVRPSFCMSSSYTFLVVTQSYVSQATHAFLGMLPLFLYYLGNRGGNCRVPMYLIGIWPVFVQKVLYLKAPIQDQNALDDHNLVKKIIHPLFLFIPSQQRWRGYSKEAIRGLLGEWVCASVCPSVALYLVGTIATTVFVPNQFQTLHVSCGWWEEEPYWFWVTGSKVKVNFGTLCKRP